MIIAYYSLYDQWWHDYFCLRDYWHMEEDWTSYWIVPGTMDDEGRSLL